MSSAVPLQQCWALHAQGDAAEALCHRFPGPGCSVRYYASAAAGRQPASLGASVEGGRLIAPSLPGFLFSVLCSLQQLSQHVPGAGSCTGLLVAASGRALARKERNGPCRQHPCWPFQLDEGPLLALALSLDLGKNRRSEPHCFPGIAFPRKEYLSSEAGNCCFCV